MTLNHRCLSIYAASSNEISDSSRMTMRNIDKRDRERIVRLNPHTFGSFYWRRLINRDVSVQNEMRGSLVEGRPRARAGNGSVPSWTWKRRLTPRRRDVANYSSRMVASNKSPVKWQHRWQLAQAGLEGKIKWGIKRETAVGENEMESSRGKKEKERKRVRRTPPTYV